MNEFKFKVVFFKQPGCPACAAMEPIWYAAANELNEEHPHLKVGFGEWDVTSDNWAFCDSVECDGTPNFVVFGEEADLLGINTEGIISKTELKDFIINCVSKLEVV